MAGKIERQIQQAKVQQAKTETPAKPSVAVPSKGGGAVAPNTNFVDARPPAIESGGAGKPITGQVRPDALWGQAPSKPLVSRNISTDPHQFDGMSPAEKAKRLDQLSAARDDLQAKILDRVVALDKKWNNSTTSTKEEALRHYAEHSDQLDPATRDEINGMLAQAAIAQRRIDRLQARRDGMPPSRNATPEQKEARKQLAKELREARKLQKDAVKDATKVVDDKGLKIDRLSETEQIIDPSAPKKDEGGSLWSMVTDFFKLTWATSFLSSIVTIMSQHEDTMKEQAKQEAATAEKRAADELRLDKKRTEKEGLQQLAEAAAIRFSTRAR